jgi:gluconolactonase
MADSAPTLVLTSTGHLFDHPEAVAIGPDGLVHAGGEAGQIYRFDLAGGPVTLVTQVAGGFILGLAHDAACNTYACDERLARVHRIAPDGAVTTYATGLPGRPMRLPNYPVFDDAGNLYVSDSGGFGARDGCIWRIAPDRSIVAWDETAAGFPNGMCLSEDGRWLFVAESAPPCISRVEIRPDGGAGRREVLVELPRTVPDGVALDVEGNLYISHYNPNMIQRLSPGGDLVTLIDDWEQLHLVAPTNIAFGGADMRTLVIASLCGWAIHTAAMPVPGLSMRYPRLPPAPAASS